MARFAQKYPAVRNALLLGLLELVCKYHKAVGGEVEVEQRETDAYGNVYKVGGVGALMCFLGLVGECRAAASLWSWHACPVGCFACRRQQSFEQRS